MQTRRLELEGLETVFSVADGLKKAVRQGLENKLEGTESEADIQRIVKEIVRGEFGV